MRKQYPYLQDSYNVTEDMNETYTRLDFLSEIDNLVTQKQYVRITLLNWQEDPLKEIQGELSSGGTLTKDGSSIFRRSCNFSCAINGNEYSVEDANMDFAINKKIFVEIGVRNDTNHFKEYPILWFPQGVFFIGTMNISSSANGTVNISLTLKDKMAGLSGDVGGKFPATVVLDEMETQTPSGEFVTEKVLIYDLIKELVNHWGGEDINNIVIDDVPLRIRRVMKWTGDTPLWMIPQSDGESGTSGQSLNLWYQVTTTPPQGWSESQTRTKKKFLTYADFQSYIDKKYAVDVQKFQAQKEEIISSYAERIQKLMEEQNKIQNIILDKARDILYRTLDTLKISRDVISLNQPDSSEDSYYSFKDLPAANAELQAKMQDIEMSRLIIEFDSEFKIGAFDKIDNTASNYPNFLQIVLSNYNTRIDDLRRATMDRRTLEQERDRELAKLNKLISNVNDITVDENGTIEIDEGDLSRTDIDIWESKGEELQIVNGTDAGYIYDDFYYTGELVMNANQSVTDALEQIKQYLGNYEYFYDVFGVFHFQEIKNYLNTTQGKIVLDDMSKKDYLVETTIPKNVYTFKGDTNLQSVTVNPQYENIKNDYVIQGQRKSGNSDFVYPVRYHLAIDRKPEPGSEYGDLLLYREEATNMVKAAFPVHIQEDEYGNGGDLPLPGNFNLIYEKDGNFYYWDDTVYKDVNVIKYYTNDDAYVTKDWRTELYLQGMLCKNYNTSAGNYYNDLSKKSISQVVKENMVGLNPNRWIGNLYQKIYTERLDIDFYFEELDAFWPQIYDLENQKFIGFDEDATLYTSSLTDGIYYLDFIDPNESGLGEFSVANIGRRSLVTVDDNINCLFQPNIPDIVFLNNDAENIKELREECMRNGQPFTQVPGDIYYNFLTGGYKNGAFDQIKYDILTHTNYQKTVSIVALPVFYLEPNSRVTLNDKTTNTYGDYVISTITIPLGGGNMSVSGSECVEKI